VECISDGTSRRYYIARDPLTHFPQAAKMRVGSAEGLAAVGGILHQPLQMLAVQNRAAL